MLTDDEQTTEQALELLATALTALKESPSTDGFPREKLARLIKSARLRLVATADPQDGGFVACVLACNELLDEALTLAGKHLDLSEHDGQAKQAIERGQAILYDVAVRAQAGAPSAEPRSLRPRALGQTSRPPKAAQPADADAPEQALRPELEPELEPELLEPEPATHSLAPSETERRRETRFQLTTEVSFEGPTNFYLGFLEDISSGGLFVSTYNVQPLGTHVAVSFSLPNGHTVHAGGTVRWTRDVVDPDEDSTPGIGIMFDELSPEDRGAIHQFIRIRAPMFYDDE